VESHGEPIPLLSRRPPRKPRVKTTLYRYYDKDWNLLYVGITSSAHGRGVQHSRTAPWWLDVAYATIRHFGSRNTALAAELLAIRSEHPRFNRAGIPYWA
jgi:hypothetical protein